MAKKIAKAAKKSDLEMCPFCGERAGEETAEGKFKCGECGKTWKKAKTVEKKVGKKAEGEVKTSRKAEKAPKEKAERPGRNSKWMVDGTYNGKKVEPIGVKKFAKPFFEGVEFPTIYGLHTYGARDFILNGKLKVGDKIIKLPKSNDGLRVTLDGKPYVAEEKPPKKAEVEEEDKTPAPAKKSKKEVPAKKIKKVLKKKAVVEDDDED